MQIIIYLFAINFNFNILFLNKLDFLSNIFKFSLFLGLKIIYLDKFCILILILSLLILRMFLVFPSYFLFSFFFFFQIQLFFPFLSSLD